MRRKCDTNAYFCPTAHLELPYWNWYRKQKNSFLPHFLPHFLRMCTPFHVISFPIVPTNISFKKFAKNFLFVAVFVYLCIWVFVYLCICIFVYLCICVFVYLSIWASVFMYLCICVFVLSKRIETAVILFQPVLKVWNLRIQTRGELCQFQSSRTRSKMLQLVSIILTICIASLSNSAKLSSPSPSPSVTYDHIFDRDEFEFEEEYEEEVDIVLELSSCQKELAKLTRVKLQVHQTAEEMKECGKQVVSSIYVIYIFSYD